jgi:hypothetical protein
MSDFWKTLANNSSSQLLTGSMDSLLSGKAHGEDFEKMRVLTDVHREANALELPIEAGTKVSFTGTLGAYMGYENPPLQNSVGEVVPVKSANGDVTHNDGMVFVQWDDGEFRSIHAEHLRLAGQDKTASKTASLVQTVRSQDWRGLMQDVKSLQRKWRQDREMTKALNNLNFYADEAWAGEDSGRYPGKAYDLAKKLDAAFAAGYPNAAGVAVFSKRATSDKSARNQTLMTWTYHGSDGDGGKTTTIVAEIIADSRGNLFMEEEYRQEDWGGAPARSHTKTKRLGTVRDPDLQEASRIFSDKRKGWTAKGRSIRSPIQYLKKVLGEQSGRLASDIKQQFEKIKGMAKEKPDSDFLKSLLKQMADKGFAPTDKQMAVVKKIEGEIKQQGQMKKELKSLGKAAELDKKGGFNAGDIGKRQNGPLVHDAEDARLMDHFGQGNLHDLSDIAQMKQATFRVASLGDLTDFLKVAEGQLIHRSTNDLWNVVADGEGFTITRLFDGNGDPLKG